MKSVRQIHIWILIKSITLNSETIVWKMLPYNGKISGKSMDFDKIRTSEFGNP